VTRNVVRFEEVEGVAMTSILKRSPRGKAGEAAYPQLKKFGDVKAFRREFPSACRGRGSLRGYDARSSSLP